jgi:hypothetical protein
MRWVGNLIDSIHTYRHIYMHYELLVNDGDDDDEPPLDCYFTNTLYICICASVDRKSTHELC